MAPISLHIHSREDFCNGEVFGSSGAYERILGTAQYSIDPSSTSAKTVVDLQYTQVDSDGLVRFSGDFCILKPKDMRKANGRLLFEVLNRGSKNMFRDLMGARAGSESSSSNNPCCTADVGNGFLMREGYTIAWAAWQGDIIAGNNRMLLHLPELVDEANGLVGVVRTEIVVDDPDVYVQRLSGNDHTQGYDPLTLKKSNARMTVRAHETDNGIELADNEWEFACHDGQGNMVPSPLHCYVKRGFKPGYIYELTYTAKNPVPLGLGFLAVQEFVSFAARGDVDAAGERNPLREHGARDLTAYGWGMSQSARFLREFIYRGYNLNDCGHRVFDGVVAHVSGGGRIQLNVRFGQPGRYPQQHREARYPSDEFPFAYAPCRDPFTGITDSIMRRPGSDPFVIHSQASAEYWERRGSLVHTDAYGSELPEHPKVRIYLFANAQHDASCQVVPSPSAVEHYRNMLRTTALNRALLVALDQWVTEGIAPPPSDIPSLERGTAATADAAIESFPKLVGVRTPSNANRLFFKSFGPAFHKGVIEEPPSVDYTQEYKVLVPTTTVDGFEHAGLKTPDLLVPLATYTGWSVRPDFPEYAAGPTVLGGVHGSTFELQPTAALRITKADPRLSIEERFGSREEYVERVKKAAMILVQQRVLLEEDAQDYIASSGAAFDAAMSGPSLVWPP